MKRRYMCSSYTISGTMPGGGAVSRHSLKDRALACAAAGYDGLWLHSRDYRAFLASGGSDKHLRDILAETGLSLFGVEFLTGWDAPDAEERSIEEYCFAAARAIDARIVTAGAGLAGQHVPLSILTKRFHALCERAADHGLEIALEFVPWTGVPDIDTALRMIEPDNAGLCIDSWHLFRGGMPVSEIAAIPREKVLCVQVNDATARPVAPLPHDTLRRLACGEGAFDLHGFAVMLDRTGVEVPFSVEIISPEFVAMPLAEAARKSLDTARSVFETSGTKAGDAAV